MVSEEAYTPTRNVFTGMAVCKKLIATQPCQYDFPIEMECQGSS